jgi:hypothetical protein
LKREIDHEQQSELEHKESTTKRTARPSRNPRKFSPRMTQMARIRENHAIGTRSWDGGELSVDFIREICVIRG